jgi:hypothetical protein
MNAGGSMQPSLLDHSSLDVINVVLNNKGIGINEPDEAFKAPTSSLVTTVKSIFVHEFFLRFYHC